MSQTIEKLHVISPDNALSNPLEVARQLTAEWRTTAVERDRQGGTAKKERDQLRSSGLLPLLVSKEYGGGGADWQTFLEVVREIAKADGSLGHLYGYHAVCATFIELFGKEAQKEKFFRTLANAKTWTGNASSENNAHVLDWRVIAKPENAGGYRLNGTKHFCSGSVDSDILLVFAVIKEQPGHDGKVIAAIIPTNREGVQVNEDWDAIGMRQTDSGSTTFNNAKVYADEVLGAPNAVFESFAHVDRGSLWTAAAQLTFSTVYLGIAEGALQEALEYTRSQSRPWTPAGVQSATEDPYTIRTYGELAILLQGANAAAREAAVSLQQAWELGNSVTPAIRADLMIKVSGVKALATQAALDITSRIFEVTGARSTHPRYGFDRFWRNVRTHTVHDPVAYKISDVGQYVLNGRHPVPGFTS
jgi:alkylation response protein AidB-like acyl-CoA dehydrogenase